MNGEIFKPRDLAAKLGVTKESLRRWEAEGKIETIKTKGGHRRYIYKSEIHQEHRKIIYTRVSSRKQSADLQRQVDFLKERFPDHEVITDIGSGLNFKRKGLQTILEQLFKKTIGEVVVAHKDRLCRFGFDLFDFMFKQHGAVLTVVDRESIKEPVTEFAEDVMSIITVFTARYYGKRFYNVYSKDKDISHKGTQRTFQQVRRRKPVLLQQSKHLHKRTVCLST